MVTEDRFHTTMRHDKQQLKFLVSTFYDFQESRNAYSNRIRQFFEEGEFDDRVEELNDASTEMEGKTERLIKDIVPEFDFYNDYLSKIRGVGPVMGANILAKFCTWSEFTVWKKNTDELKWYWIPIDEDEDKWIVKKPPALEVASKVTKFWSYCGLTDEDIRESGKKLNHNPEAKVLFCHKLPSFLAQSQSLYNTEIKAKHKDRLLRTREDIQQSEKPGPHAEGIARTIAGKHFASHIWLVWRDSKGLRTPEFYHSKHLDGHDDVVMPFVEQPEFRSLDIDFD